MGKSVSARPRAQVLLLDELAAGCIAVKTDLPAEVVKSGIAILQVEQDMKNGDLPVTSWY